MANENNISSTPFEPGRNPGADEPMTPPGQPGGEDQVEQVPGNPDWQSPPENPSQFPREQPGQNPESNPFREVSDLPREPKPAWVGDPNQEEIRPENRYGGSRPDVDMPGGSPERPEEASNQPRD